MTAEIVQVNVFGFNHNQIVKPGRRRASVPQNAQNRFPVLKPGHLVITGHYLDEVDSLSLVYRRNNKPAGYTFVLIDKVVSNSNEQLDVWFIAWKEVSDEEEVSKGGDVEPDNTGDLTVTVETVTPLPISGNDPSVIVQD